MEENSRSKKAHYYEARNDYTNNSGTILLCNRCVRNRKTNSQTILVCNWRLQKVPPGCARITNEIIPVSELCVTDVLCN